MKRRIIFQLILILVIITGLGLTYKSLIMGNAVFFSDLGVGAQMNSVDTKKGTHDYSYVASVGGIAFQKTAAPAEGLNVISIELKYTASRKDGERLSCVVNGNELTVPLYDWELKPIFLFSDSQFTSCFSLFGNVESIRGKSNPPKEEVYKYREENNIQHFASFHPSFQNTLLGLRLMQMDAFYRLKEFAALPTGNYHIFFRKIILGNGENISSRNSASSGDNQNTVANIMASERYTSYVITDDTDYYSVPISFKSNGTSIAIDGEPFVFFWDKRVNESKLRRLITKYSLSNKYFETINATLNNPRDSDALSRLNQLALDDISSGSENQDSLIAKIRNIRSEAYDPYNNNFDVLYVKSLSEKFIANPGLIRNINPIAYDATRKAMRYSSFFRYCKRINPANFESIKTVIRDIDIDPAFRDYPNAVVINTPIYKKDTPIWVLYIIISGIVLLIVGGVTIFILLKKRNLNSQPA